MNPKVMTDFPVKESASGAPFYKNVGIAPGRWAGIDYFYSVGDNVQSAEYHGNNPEYDGTVYPIDSNGNITISGGITVVSQTGGGNAPIDGGDGYKFVLTDGSTVLIRKSGTEPLIRVMVEAETDNECKKYVDKIAAMLILQDYLNEQSNQK